MGSSPSKPSKPDPLSICKLRRTQVKSAIESRYALAASHLTYTNSLRNIGATLRRYAESEVLSTTTTEPLSTAAAAAEKTATTATSPLSHPSSPSSHLVSDSPSPLGSTPVSRLSYMKSSAGAVTVAYHPGSVVGVAEAGVVVPGDEDGEPVGFSLPPPPPPSPPGEGGGECSWDYFGPVGDEEDGNDFVDDNNTNNNNNKGFSFVGEDDDNLTEKLVGRHRNSSDVAGVGEEEAAAAADYTAMTTAAENERRRTRRKGQQQQEKQMCGGGAERREDPSEYITHRAKDFVSSIKDIEHRFFKAAESGKEVSRMLEVNRIRVGYAEVMRGKSSDQVGGISAAFRTVCCRGGKSVHASYDLESTSHHHHNHHATKIITWKRSLSSSQSSSSSRHPATIPPATTTGGGGSKSDADDSGSDLVEEFCMISGSHSSSLDRLYAWEQKLCDEVKASESITKVYDRTCSQLGQQFANNVKSKVIDKTRATVKDLHSRVRVSLHSVDAIAKRIEKMRDEELQPQLVELVQGFIRMWKTMLESHHAQYITISLAYHAKLPPTHKPNPDNTRRQLLNQLIYEFECFGASFSNWVSSHTSYIESLNGWLQSSIIQPKDQSHRSSKNRPRPLSPRRVLAPPIFVLCRDWAVGVRTLPADEVSEAVGVLLADLHRLMREELDEEGDDGKGKSDKLVTTDDNHGTTTTTAEYGGRSNLQCVHSSMTKLLDRLTKFSEAALKLYEDVKQKNEAAHAAYVKGGTSRPTSNVYYQ